MCKNKKKCDCGNQLAHLASMLSNDALSREDKSALNWAMQTLFDNVRKKSEEHAKVIGMSLTLARLDAKISVIPFLKDGVSVDEYIIPLLDMIRKELGQFVEEKRDGE